MNPKSLQFKRLHPNAVLPTRATSGAACYDLRAVEGVVVPASHTKQDGSLDIGQAFIATGWAVCVPHGFAGRVGARSGLSFKNHIEVGAGWIDADYRGELKVKLINFSSQPFTIEPGDRIAQFALVQIATPAPEEVLDLPPTERGEQGFGSTGVQ